MKTKGSEKSQHLGSIEEASIIVKFSVLFIVMSLLPLCVLFYFYFQFKETGRLEISEPTFYTVVSFIGWGSFFGYWTMRTILQKIIDLSKAHQRVLEGVLSPQTIQELSIQKNEINVLAQSFGAITQRLEENVKSLELAKRTLHSIMTRVGEGIANLQNINTFLDLIIETLTNAIHAKVGVLMLYDKDNRVLEATSIYGSRNIEEKNFYIDVPKNSPIETIMRSKSPHVVFEPSADIPELQRYERLLVPPILLAPLIFKDKPRGLIIVSGRDSDDKFQEEELMLIQNLASQTAVAIENVRLNENAEKTYFETISALALAVDARDKYSRGHLDRVANYCEMIGKKLGLEPTDLKTLRDAARLHDLGKIGIPDEVLWKNGPLNDQEWLLMRKHPEIGEGIIKPVHSLEHLCDIIRHHHEKLDGSGYPDGLKGDEIGPLVRVATIADIYDALTTIRPYRKRLTEKEAYETLRSMKDQLDQDIVSGFIDALNEQRLS